MTASLSTPLGAFLVAPRQCRFSVWAPLVKSVEVEIVGPDKPRFLSLTLKDEGYFEGIFDDVPAGTRYFYRLNGKDRRPDPLSHYQPEGVFGPSEVIDQNFNWTDQKWKGLPLRDYVLYELHVGTFSKEGTFAGILPQLDYLKDLGVTAIEIMPISQFSGGRNWGYDGVLHYAVQNTYGRPEDLKHLIDTCHKKGLAVILDVVYNHLGPEGNYIQEFGPYFTKKYSTPWGASLNYDDPQSNHVRRYFVENAVYWVKNFHFDGLRLDAVQTIIDVSAKHVLEEIADAVKVEAQRSGRQVFLMGESDLNNERFVLPKEKMGLGLDSQWDDDFHHVLHSCLSGEEEGYYRDYGRLDQLAKSYKEGWVYTGEYSVFRQKNHGRPAPNSTAENFIVFAQNHDQIGNRAMGDRLNQYLPFEKYKLAAAAMILSPFIPMLFMGEEYGETAPFQYFVSHIDPELVRAVRKGRREEFKAFAWQEEVPLPDAEETFLNSKLNHELKKAGKHAVILSYYKELLNIQAKLRRSGLLSRPNLNVQYTDERSIIELHYKNATAEARVVMNFSDEPQNHEVSGHDRSHQVQLNSADRNWDGPGAPDFKFPKLSLAAHSALVLGSLGD